MNLGQTGLLPDKREVDGVFREPKCAASWNLAIDIISQIPFDPMKFVEVDEEKLANLDIIQEHCELLSMAIMFYGHKARLDWIYKKKYELAHALASTKDRWMKIKEAS